MIRLGIARIYTFPDNWAQAAAMYALERDARAARRGIWADPFYAVRGTDPAALLGEKGTFQVVEGKVVSAADVKGVMFLNFGDNWRTDFTVRVAKQQAKLFKKADLNTRTYEGKHIRARGWIKDWNGPMIEASHPKQIDILESR
ncbi:MAG: hypothetical protein VW268_08485 [Rhodospirillaceae bacterium]